MKTKMSALLFFIVAATASSVSYAGADDAAWIGKCVADNAKEGAAPETVQKYCSCMNNKMSDNETLSISAWETSHPKEMKECEAAAGWK
jgi:hypothetical protein